MPEKEKKEQTQSASTELKGDVMNQFEEIKTHMVRTLPGITPKNAEVTRYAINRASLAIRAEQESKRQAG